MINRILMLEPNDTICSVLERNRGKGPSFDVLRLLLAVAIFVLHARWVAGMADVSAMGNAVATGAPAAPAAPAPTGAAVHREMLTLPLMKSLVPAFFALSGFLVLGSALRLRATSTFLAHRGLRIFPALAVEVIFCAILLGPMLTSLPLQQYSSEPLLFRYFGNALGFVTYHLPGVFEQNPVSGVVNASLWTLPSEFYCYVIIAALLLTRAAYSRTFFAIGLLAITLSLAYAHFLFEISAPTTGHYPAHVIVYYFFVGTLLYHYRDHIPVNVGLFLACLALAYVGLAFDQLAYLAPIPLTYCTIFFGLVRLPKPAFISRGDYSYGIYLYSFPIAQAYMALIPELKGHGGLLIALAGISSCVFAALSWHLIERRTLELKQHLPQSWFPVTLRAAG
ncbi:acyltransferase [Bradyrhizobium diazoefficiens]|uniref:acyltransferase family protein n=1 Tax=Bradyrhizobium diazoefficiens TaxID=1355477 RepID=UPI00190A42D6|nr:acyltransferase [Bradyrhizobium diazoefficiens]QQO13539.1 acyltransferase [Bradyrhizobium diazoefficiens]